MTQTLFITLRIKDEQDNLFVRLSQRTLQQLLADEYDNSISFLPLSISFDGNVTVYASWNGGICEYDGESMIFGDDSNKNWPMMIQFCHYRRTNTCGYILLLPSF